MFFYVNMDLTWTVHGLDMDLGAARPQPGFLFYIVFQLVNSFFVYPISQRFELIFGCFNCFFEVFQC